MALNLKNPEAERMARELARRQGRSITAAVMGALEAELERERHRARPAQTSERMLEIARRFSRLPTLDTRSDDEILGFDELGTR
jgi:antitoxin VapB